MPNTYNYIDTSGNMQQFQADTPEAALSGAPNIDPKSGVQIVTAPTQPAQSPIVTTGPQWTNYNNATNSLNNFVNTADPYMALFQQQRDANKLAAENAIASATAEKERAAIKTEEERNAVMAGLATAAEKTGLAPNSAYQLQVIQGAQNSFNTRFELLDRQEKLAIAKAKAAQAVGDTAVLKEQLDYVTKLRSEKARALEEAQKLEWEKYKFENLSAYQKAQLAESSGGGGLGWTNSELKKLEQANIDPKDRKRALDYLYGNGTSSGSTSGTVYNKDWFSERFTRSELFNLVPKLFTAKDNPRVKDLSKKREIESVLDRLQVLVNGFKANGLDDAEINTYLDSLVE